MVHQRPLIAQGVYVDENALSNTHARSMIDVAHSRVEVKNFDLKLRRSMENQVLLSLVAPSTCAL